MSDQRKGYDGRTDFLFGKDGIIEGAAFRGGYLFAGISLREQDQQGEVRIDSQYGCLFKTNDGEENLFDGLEGKTE